MAIDRYSKSVVNFVNKIYKSNNNYGLCLYFDV